MAGREWYGEKAKKNSNLHFQLSAVNKFFLVELTKRMNNIIAEKRVYR